MNELKYEELEHMLNDQHLVLTEPGKNGLSKFPILWELCTY